MKLETSTQEFCSIEALLFYLWDKQRLGTDSKITIEIKPCEKHFFEHLIRIANWISEHRTQWQEEEKKASEATNLRRNQS